MAAFLTFLLFVIGLNAKDLGTYGQTFPIAEQSLLDLLQERMNSLSQDELTSRLREFQAKAQEQIKHPTPVSGLQEASKYRIFYHNPTVCVPRDIEDEKGALIVKKGTCVNPLDTVSINRPLLFLDGSNQQHIEWAKSYDKAHWVLVKGSPIELEQDLKRLIYFDQGGKLIEKFQIKAIPAQVSQEKLMLKIEEIPTPKETIK